MSWYKPRRTLKSVADELAEGLGNGTIALSEVAEGTSVEPEVELLEDPFQRVPLNWGMSREEWELVTSHSVDRPEEEHIDNPSLPSGYKSNKINWLLKSPKSFSEFDV
jgi:hypothetical protein